jgi:hypothetical protein
MYRLARFRDAPSADLFRAFAAKQDPPWFAHRMPIVLADYIEDPASVPRRIRGHDHDWMFWLAEAASLLDIEDGEPALSVCAETAPDECREICRDALNGLLAERARPKPSWDIET